ncbi:MAG: hypothetical protein E7454_00370 [Ruminococcaceae bacterium]|nr:hypothetical protein [Oscillospiraceae bacterium]
MDTPEQIKIWQRVHAQAPPVTDGLPGLAANALAATILYGNLAQRFQGRGRKILLQLQQEEGVHARCLKGIYQLIAGVSMNVAAVPPDTTQLIPALRKSYAHSLKALAAYEARTRDSEYGVVFSFLAEQQRSHCCQIAELIGLLEV